VKALCVGNLWAGPSASTPSMPTPPPAGSSALMPQRPAPAPTRPERRGRGWRALLAVGVIAIVTGALPLRASPPATAAGGRPYGPLVPASGFYVGAYTKHVDGYGLERQKHAIKDLETRLGRRLHIDHHFYAWEDDFPTWREPWDLAHDRIPMISWNGTNTASIASGAYDGLILQRAEGIRELGQPVFLRWFWEMDGTKKADWAISPESYVDAWRRIHDLFAARNVTNAVWVWCPNASAFDDNALSYYPGGAYVDWVCADGYNFAPNRPNDRWRGFGEIFEHFYDVASKLKKPMMIGEVGVLEREPDEKAQWFREAHDVIATRFPAIAALVYFNADSTEKGVYFDWRVDTSPSSFEGFRHLFTGPAPIPSGLPAAPADAGTPEPLVASKAEAAKRPVAKRVEQPRGSATPAPPPSGTKQGKARLGSRAPKAPSARMTWVLQLLRQLESQY
jgi:hypothetical protein